MAEAFPSHLQEVFSLQKNMCCRPHRRGLIMRHLSPTPPRGGYATNRLSRLVYSLGRVCPCP
jgi:hypothetical protein